MRPGRFELPTPGFVDLCSIQLSYGRKRDGHVCRVSKATSRLGPWKGDFLECPRASRSILEEREGFEPSIQLLGRITV